MKKIIFSIQLISILLFSCRKDETKFIGVNDRIPVPTEFINSTLSGQVVDESNTPIQSAKVIVGGKQVNTDKNGIFSIQDATVDKNRAYIVVEKQGYFHASKTIKPQKNTRMLVHIQMLSNQDKKTISAENGGIADFQNYSVSLPAKVVIKANGEPYLGQIHVAAKWLNPESENFGNQSPGDFTGITTNSQVTNLISRGMMAVELTDESGNPLQIHSNSEALIKIKAVGSESSNPPTIPMWYFDEKHGYWIEEGKGHLVNGFYEAKVKHFTYWNWDFPSPTIPYKLKVIDSEGKPMSDIWVRVKMLKYLINISSQTDSNGELDILLTPNELFELYLSAPGRICDDPFLIEQIGPFSQNQNRTIIVDKSKILNPIKIYGQLNDCNNVGVRNGYVKAKLGQVNTIFFMDQNGAFSYTFQNCFGIDSIEIQGHDYNSIKETDVLTFPLNGSDLNIGTITTCKQPIEHYEVYLMNDTFRFSFFHTYLIGDTLRAIYGAVDRIHVCKLEIKNTALIGNQQDPTLSGWYTLNNEKFNFTYDKANPNLNLKINLTRNEGVGGYIEGVFNGKVLVSNASTTVIAPISGKLLIKVTK